MKLTPANSRRRGVAAFTMAEVAIAVGIAGVALAAIFSGIAFAFSLVKQSREDLRATQIMNEKLESLRLYTWDQLTNTTAFTLTGFTNYYDPQSTNEGAVYIGTVSLSLAPVTASYSTDMCSVVVSVTWTNGTTVRKRSMQSYFSHYGLQRYIYYN